MIFFASFSHAYNYKGNERPRIEYINGLSSHALYWSKVGLVFRELFYKSTPDVVIATTAAGIIPYYSQLITVDMHGLNDRWIAKNGINYSPMAGHQKLSTHKYLVDRGVNLVIGFPMMLYRELDPQEIRKLGITNLFKDFMIIDAQKSLISDTTEIIEIPIDNISFISVLYIKKNNYIDDIIRKKNFKTYKLFQS